MARIDDLDHEQLNATILKSFGIQVEELSFLQVGFVGRHYHVRSVSGEQYFLTLYDDGRVARIAAQKLDFTIALLHRLYQSGSFGELLPPLFTLDGKMWAEYKGWPLLAYPFLDGHLLADEMPLNQEVMTNLGSLVGRLHTATPIVKGIPRIVREQFFFHFEAPLRHGLQELADPTRQDRDGPNALRTLLLPYRGTILELLDRLHALAEPLRRSPPPMVICHTDIHPWNIFRKSDGSLVVIDWDGVCLAPAEHDLFIFDGEGFETLLRAYYLSGGRRDLSAETFSFYFLRRNLEDLADFVYRILHENVDPQTTQGDLTGTQEQMAGWAGLAAAEKRMRAILSEV